MAAARGAPVLLEQQQVVEVAVEDLPAQLRQLTQYFWAQPKQSRLEQVVLVRLLDLLGKMELLAVTAVPLVSDFGQVVALAGEEELAQQRQEAALGLKDREVYFRGQLVVLRLQLLRLGAMATQAAHVPAVAQVVE